MFRGCLPGHGGPSSPDSLRMSVVGAYSGTVRHRRFLLTRAEADEYAASIDAATLASLAPAVAALRAEEEGASGAAADDDAAPAPVGLSSAFRFRPAPTAGFCAGAEAPAA